MFTRLRPALAATIVTVSLLPLSLPAQNLSRAGTVTTGTLLAEMGDLARLASLPDPFFEVMQFSSYDRRSRSPDAEGWYSNADGFGGEPIPGFLTTLREAGADGVGLYLMVDETGPGAIVRTWSAGMGGILRVYLDGADEPCYEGDAYRFLARKAEVFLEAGGIDGDFLDIFCQQDADYFPIPYAAGVRLTWEGKLDELHFYHVEVRRYPEGTRVRTFNTGRELRAAREELELIPARVLSGRRRAEQETTTAPPTYVEQAELAPGTSWDMTLRTSGTAGAITQFGARVEADDVDRALRGTLLQLAFDGAGQPQVEAPLGDFFGSGPGVNPFESTPVTVDDQGRMTSRWVMPFQEKTIVRLTNLSDATVTAHVSFEVSPWSWDERSLYFRARWRSDTDLDVRTGPIDLPYAVVHGAGRLVGVAAMVVNPSAVPTPGGNWWGEGDEKIFVDDESFPRFYGTGSEDYFNYSWSRPDLFDHPYCGQPLDTGPGNLGYVSNHRWHILDSVPFRTALAFYMELWPHRAQPGLGYARIAYYYARPGARDDHRRLVASELIIPSLPAMEPQAYGGANNATFHPVAERTIRAEGGETGGTASQPGASRGRLLTWRAEPGERIAIPVAVAEAGTYTINLVAAHWPESGVIRVLCDGEPLIVNNLGGAGEGLRGTGNLVLRTGYGRRLLSTAFERVDLAAGNHTLVIECAEPGLFGFDYVWIRKQ